MPNPWNNPYIPGDPFSYDLKWVIQRLKEHGVTIQQILDEMPDESEIKQIIQNMFDTGDITALALESIGIYNVKDYGAKGDQLTDDYDAIMTCYAAAEAAKGIMYFPNGTYLTSRTIEMPSPVHIVMEGTIFSSIQAPIVIVGDTDDPSWFYYQNWKIKGISGVNTGSVGLVLQNITSSRFMIDEIRFVETGVKFVGNTEGFQNNTIFMNEITDVKYGIILDAINSGWVNDNLFIGGRFSKYTSMTGATTTAITITSSDGSRVNNNNVFLKPNLEKNDIGIAFEYASLNHVYEPRMEGVTTSAVYSNGSAYNMLITGYGNMAKTSMLNQQTGARFNWGLGDENMKYEMLPAFVKSSVCNASTGCVKDYGAVVTSNGAFQYHNPGLKYTVPAGNDCITLTGASYTGSMIDVKGDGRAVFFWKPITKSTAPNNAYGVFRMFDATGAEVTDHPEYFPGQQAAKYTAGNIDFFRFGSNEIGYSFIIPANVTRIFAGIQILSGQSEDIITMVFGSNIPFAIERHDLVLGAIPTSTNSPTGEIVANGASAEIWIAKSDGTWNTLT